MRPVVIARGVTRAVLLIGPYAVKVPRIAPSGRGLLWSLAHGILANLSEREWSAWPGVVPVRWSLAGLVNVYRRADPVPADVPLDMAVYLAIAAPGVPVDPKRANVGLVDGRLVWIDYADAGECVACGRYAHEQRKEARR